MTWQAALLLALAALPSATLLVAIGVMLGLVLVDRVALAWRCRRVLR